MPTNIFDFFLIAAYPPFNNKFNAYIIIPKRATTETITLNLLIILSPPSEILYYIYLKFYFTKHKVFLRIEIMSFILLNIYY